MLAAQVHSLPPPSQPVWIIVQPPIRLLLSPRATPVSTHTSPPTHPHPHQVVWIAASRLYLGLHTPIDILAGALAGLATLVCFIGVEGGWEWAVVVSGRGQGGLAVLLLLLLPRLGCCERSPLPPLPAGVLARWVFSGPQAVLHTALASLVLLRLHPRPLAPTPSFEFTTSFMGVSAAAAAAGGGGVVWWWCRCCCCCFEQPRWLYSGRCCQGF